MDTIAKLLVGTVSVAFVALVLGIVNEWAGTVEPYGDVYPAQFSYCAARTTIMAGKVPVESCTYYKTGTEMRQATHVKGLFWNNDSYRVVR